MGGGREGLKSQKVKITRPACLSEFLFGVLCPSSAEGHGIFLAPPLLWSCFGYKNPPSTLTLVCEIPASLARAFLVLVLRYMQQMSREQDPCKGAGGGG